AGSVVSVLGLARNRSLNGVRARTRQPLRADTTAPSPPRRARLRHAYGAVRLLAVRVYLLSCAGWSHPP
ncbi:hypothetical protein N4P33_19890, partial [Streptomyces sp. 15-116A]|uniref:hypothetical protein n=1 Tax=Streptomyces sp. 15-116A TaxID=2259035 RepID=UPI0021B4161C